MLDAFRLANSRSRDVIYTRQHLENVYAEFGGRDNTETLKSFLRTYYHISGLVTERGMMVEYERSEMLLRALPKRLWRQAISKLGFNPLEPHTFEYGKVQGWIAARFTAPEALTMFDFLAPAALPLTTFSVCSTPATPNTHTTSPPLLVSPAPTASRVPFAFAVAEIPTTTPTAKQDTIGAGPTVGLGISGVEPPRGPLVRRHHFV